MVCVIVPFFDPPLRFFEEAIASVHAQTFTDWELLLVDDGSVPSVAAYARRQAEDVSGRVRYLEFEGHAHRSHAGARNLGLRHARGRYVATLDADDVWVPEKLARQVSILEGAPDVGWVYGTTRYWYGWTGDPRSEGRDFVQPHILRPSHELRRAGRLDPPHLLSLYMRAAVALPSISSVMCRRSIALDVDGFDERFLLYEDQTFLAKLCLVAPVILSDECWDLYRQHPDSLTARMRGSREERQSRRLYLEWLAQYVERGGERDPVLRAALRREMWAARLGLPGRIANGVVRRLEKAFTSEI